MAEHKSVHQYAFWLYGVVVGLAIKSALETTVPHLINPPKLIKALKLAGEHTIPFDHSQMSWPEVLRLAVFLALIIRFYFGSAFFFGEAHESETADAEYAKKNYGLDFIFGFLHFIFFFVLALTIDFHTAPVYWFPRLVGLVLVYDLIWYGFSFTQDTSKLIFWWMIVNLITALIGSVLYVSFADPIRAERWALWPVLLVSVVDIGLMMIKRPFFEPIANLAPGRKSK